MFPFPTIDGNVGAMGGGDTIVVFEGSDANIAVVKDWITPEWQCTHASATGGGISPYGGHGVDGVEFLPGNKNVDPNCYITDAAKSYATAVDGGTGGEHVRVRRIRPDGSGCRAGNVLDGDDRLDTGDVLPGRGRPDRVVVAGLIG